MAIMSRLELYFSFEYSHYNIASENVIRVGKLGIQCHSISLAKKSRQFIAIDKLRMRKILNCSELVKS